METLPQRTTTREDRGRDLARARFEEIRRIGRRTWTVPACSGGHAYLVQTGPISSCSCEDSTRRNGHGESCKHQEAVKYVKAVSAECAECGTRHRFRNLTEVPEERSSLTYFEGDMLCPDCLHKSDVIL